MVRGSSDHARHRPNFIAALFQSYGHLVPQRQNAVSLYMAPSLT